MKKKTIKLPTDVIILAVVSIAFITAITGGTGLIGAIIGFFCGRHNYKRAVKYKRGGTCAFLLGQWFNLIGLLAYDIYLSNKGYTKKDNAKRVDELKSWRNKIKR